MRRARPASSIRRSLTGRFRFVRACLHTLICPCLPVDRAFGLAWPPASVGRPGRVRESQDFGAFCNALIADMRPDRTAARCSDFWDAAHRAGTGEVLLYVHFLAEVAFRNSDMLNTKF